MLTEDIMTLFLAWSTSGITFQELSNLFKLVPSTIRKAISKVEEHAKEPLVTTFITSNQEHEDEATSFIYFPDAMGAVDCTAIQICKPKDYQTQQAHYNPTEVYCVTTAP